MLRLLLILGLVLLLVWWFFGRRPPRPEPPSSDGAAPPAGPQAPQELVACAHCGLRLPRAEALADPAAPAAAHPRFYCCDAHRQSGPAR